MGLRPSAHCEDCGGALYVHGQMLQRDGWWKCGNCGAINVPEGEATPSPETPPGNPQVKR